MAIQSDQAGPCFDIDAGASAHNAAKDGKGQTHPMPAELPAACLRSSRERALVAAAGLSVHSLHTMACISASRRSVLTMWQLPRERLWAREL